MAKGIVVNDLRTPLAESPAESTIVDPEAVVDLMVALERVFKIGVYYPSGHAMCDQAADLFLRALTKVIAKAPALRFECGRENLSVQGFELDLAMRGVRGFLGLLNEVGISAVEFDSTVTAADLHRFVTQMLHYRNRIKGAHDFQQVIVDGMPPTIAVEHLEFVARDVGAGEGCGPDGGPGGGDAANPSLEALLATLLKHGLTPQEMARCRRLLEAVPGYLQENRLTGVALPQVSWADVERLLLRAAKQPSGGSGEGTGNARAPSTNLDALAAIFASLGEKHGTADPHQAIDLLVALSRRTPPSPDPETTADAASLPKPAAAPPVTREDQPIADLRAALAACAEKDVGALQFEAENRGEILTILMQMLQRDQKPQAQLRIQKQLRDILRSPLQPAERAIAVAGTQDLLGLGGADRLHGALRIITEALRSSEHSAPLRFLCDVVRGRPREDLLRLWPFLVNELLLTGSRNDMEIFEEACDAAARPTPAEMEAGLPVLETLESLRDRRCARDVFAPPPTETVFRLRGPPALASRALHRRSVAQWSAIQAAELVKRGGPAPARQVPAETPALPDRDPRTRRAGRGAGGHGRERGQDPRRGAAEPAAREAARAVGLHGHRSGCPAAGPGRRAVPARGPTCEALSGGPRLAGGLPPVGAGGARADTRKDDLGRRRGRGRRRQRCRQISTSW